MAKLIVDLQRGLIEVEGEEEFVERVYTDVSETLVRQLKAPPLAPAAPNSDESVENKPDKKATRKRVKSSGPSCASRIQEIQSDGFFKDLRGVKDVVAKLSERGANYEPKQVSASLLDLVKRGVLRRITKDGSWAYQNP